MAGATHRVLEPWMHKGSTCLMSSFTKRFPANEFKKPRILSKKALIPQPPLFCSLDTIARIFAPSVTMPRTHAAVIRNVRACNNGGRMRCSRPAFRFPDSLICCVRSAAGAPQKKKDAVLLLRLRQFGNLYLY